MPYVIERYLLDGHWTVLGRYTEQMMAEGAYKGFRASHPDWTLRLVEVLKSCVGKRK